MSIAFTLAKAFEVNLDFLKEISYGWVAAPLVLWLMLAYRNRRLSHLSFIEKYDHALWLQAVNYNKKVDTETGEVIEYQYVLALKNVGKQPLKYSVVEFGVDDTFKSDLLQNHSGIIRSKATSNYSLPILEGHIPTMTEIVSLKILYGSPKQSAIRQWNLKLSVAFYDSGNGEYSTNYINLEDDDQLVDL